MSDTIAPSLLTLPVELLFRIFDDLDELTIFIYVRNVCTQLKAITDAYLHYQVNPRILLF
jgi:hypothetical protein